MMNKERFTYLFEQYKSDRMTETEWDEWREAIDSGQYDNLMKALFRNLAESKEMHPSWTTALKEKLWHEVMQETVLLENNSQPGNPPIPMQEKKIPLRHRIFKYGSIAASLLLLIALAWLLKPTERTIKKPSALQISKNDIEPGSNKAILQLANGKRIVLDSTNNGLILNLNGSKIIKTNGSVAISATDESHHTSIPENDSYNIISTPRGGQYQLILPDGTKVWLNSSSSLKFPTAFRGNERHVELVGEGYFEVAKNASMPFFVSVNQMKVEVLGTHFNIMAYDDEKSINTTLLEGSVKILESGDIKKLVPGQQAVLDRSNHQVLIAQADIQKTMAWKNGLFEFDNTDLKTIMRQLVRWYDIEIVYQTNPDQTPLGGSISKNLNLREVLALLEANGINHFKIEGRKVFVFP
ncbi:MAG: FecR family protein [Bacteroidetes bacterium]|nr:FecR family protein [Bacteroidota bacterium]